MKLNSNLWFSVLALSKPRLSVESKMTLIHLLRQPQGQPVTLPRLAELTCLSKDALRSARTLLRGEHWLDCPPLEPGEGGIPVDGNARTVFEVTVACKKALVEAVEKNEWVRRLLNSPHHTRMVDLLFPARRSFSIRSFQTVEKKPGRPKREEGQIGVTTRMLLAILLGFADGVGVVRDVGKVRLAGMLGLQEKSLDYQLGLLTQQGFLRSRVAGVAGQRIFGRAAGVFFLNLGHPGLASPVPEILICGADELFDAPPFLLWRAGFGAWDAAYTSSLLEVGSAWQEPKEEGALLSTIRQWLQEGRVQLTGQLLARGQVDGLLKQEAVDRLVALWNRFELWSVLGERPGSFGRLLQYQVESCASSLLSWHWAMIDAADNHEWPESLFSQLRQELLPDVLLKKVGQYAAQVPDALTLFVFTLALRLSYGLKTMLMQGLTADDPVRRHPTQYRFTLLPMPLGRLEAARFALSVTSHDATKPLAPKVVCLRRESRSLRWALSDEVNSLQAEEQKKYWRQSDANT